MRLKVVLQTLTASSSRSLDLKPRDLRNKKPSEILLNVLPEKTRESEKTREYFERAMFSPENFDQFSEDEKYLYVDLVKRILSKAFLN